MFPKISIIIPCYNQSMFFDKCITSIYFQTFKNWECLLIDDGSTDNTAEISKIWEAKDQRFRYFYKENGGVSSARNMGIENSRGEFIIFIDSDDFLHNNMSLHHFAAVTSEDSDLISANFCFVHKDDKISYPNESEIIQEQEVLIEEEILKAYLNQRISGIGCNKLIRKSFLNKLNIRFDENLSHFEDFLFFLECYSDAEKMVLIPQITYCYNKSNPNSASTLSRTFQKEKFQNSQLALLQAIAKLAEKPRWQLLDTKNIIQYFSKNYQFLKDESFIENKKLWKKMYKKVQKTYQSSILNLMQKRFVYNANISYFAYSRIKKMKNQQSLFYRLMSRFITF